MSDDEWPAWIKENVWDESSYGVPAMGNFVSKELLRVYEDTRKAIQDCTRIEQLVSWAKKAAAMAHYAQKIDDRSMEYTAKRLHLCMVRKMGELLLAIEPDVGGRPKKTQEACSTSAPMRHIEGLEERRVWVSS